MNIDALLGETDDRVLTYKGKDFPLPSEIPGECLAPFLADDLNIVDLITDALKSDNDGRPWTDVLIDTVRARPRLPLELLAATKESFRILLGDSYAPLMAEKPGLGFYYAFARSLPDEYGLDFGDFLGSSGSSEPGGDNSNPTSPTTTPESTPETSGATPTTEDAPVAPAPVTAEASA